MPPTSMHIQNADVVASESFAAVSRALDLTLSLVVVRLIIINEHIGGAARH